MQMKMLRAITVVALAISLRGFAAEGEKEKPLAEKIDGTDPEDQDYFDRVLAEDKKAADQRKEQANQLASKHAELEGISKAKLALGSATVTIDEATKDVAEPDSMEAALNFPAGQRVRDAYEINPEDLPIDPHERWSINTSDFKFDRPQYITSDSTFGSDKTWFGFGYSITNTTPKPRRIVPIFLAIRGIVRNENDPHRSDDPTLKNFIPKGFDYGNTGFRPECPSQPDP